MIALVSRVKVLLISFLAAVQVVVELLGANTAWTQPHGSLGDFGQTFGYNSMIDLSWNSLNTSTSDLWITAWDQGTDNYAKRIAQSINISLPGSLEYSFGVLISQLAINAQFVFHFVPAGTIIGSPYFGPAVSSPGILVLAQSNETLINATSSTAGAATLTKATSSTAVKTASASTPSTHVSSAPQPSTTTGISTAAKACIGVGVSLGVVLVVMAAFVVVRRHRKKRDIPLYGAGHNSSDMVDMKKDQDCFADSSIISELLAQAKVAEMDGMSRSLVEVSSDVEKDQMHELRHELST